MKLATSLLVIVLIAVGALLFLGGLLIDRRPNAELCNAAYALVKRQIPNDAVRREGECLVTGSGVLPYRSRGLQHGDFAGNGGAADRLRSKGGL
ncbi:MAG: hypothetical protein ACREV4_09605 [Gammaproteobacteria bacterium]